MYIHPSKILDMTNYGLLNFNYGESKWNWNIQILF